MIHLVLMVPLLTAPPSLVQRLQLGVVGPELVQTDGGLRSREIGAGVGGMVLGQALVAGELALMASHVFKGCADGSSCTGAWPAAPMWTAVAVTELLVPALAAGFAWWAVEPPMTGSYLRAWGLATLGHLGAVALAVGSIALGPVGALLISIPALVADLIVPPLLASYGLHSERDDGVEPSAPLAFRF